jgi:multimeric flavodoxin WrbA
MKILVLTGSPRRDGNSGKLAGALIRGAIDGGKEAVQFECARHRVTPCRGCNACIREGNGCVIKDAFPAHEIETADAIVFASPLYWGGVSAQLKLVWDRLHAYTRGPGRARQHIKRSALLITLHADPKIAGPLVEIYRDCSKFMDWTDSGSVIAGGLLEKTDIDGSAALDKAYELGVRI